MLARTIVGGSVVALAVTCAAPAVAAQNPGPARVKGNVKIGGDFRLPFDGGGGLDFRFSATVNKVKAIYYNSGDAAGFHMAKKKPHGTLQMTYVRTEPPWGCEETQDTETIGFGGPVSAEINGLRTVRRGGHYKVTDRRFSITWSAMVNLHTMTRSVGNFFDCVTTITEDDQLQRVEIEVQGRLDRNNRTGQVTVGNWGPVYISGIGIGAGHPPDDRLPMATGTITFDRDVRLAT